MPLPWNEMFNAAGYRRLWLDYAPNQYGKALLGKALELRKDSLGRRYCVDEVNGKVRRAPCGREGLPELKARRAARDKAAVDKAQAAIDAYRKGDSDAATMLASLQGLTRDQLRGLREGLGVGKGDGLKKDLADKISKAALGTLEARHLEPMGERPGIDENSDKEVDKPAGGPTIRVDAKSPVEERPVTITREKALAIAELFRQTIKAAQKPADLFKAQIKVEVSGIGVGMGPDGGPTSWRVELRQTGAASTGNNNLFAVPLDEEIDEKRAAKLLKQAKDQFAGRNQAAAARRATERRLNQE